MSDIANIDKVFCFVHNELNFYKIISNSNNDINSQSNLIIQESITSNQLAKGAIIKLTWHPNRICVVRHNGIGNFEVIDAENTKLVVGDRFNCNLFINHEPLYIDNLIHCGEKPIVYVAGRKDGIIFEVITK